jgi:hypothetical protein
MDQKTKQLVREWLGFHRGDTEALARWMRDTLRLGGIRECRALIREAVEA